MAVEAPVLPEAPLEGGSPGLDLPELGEPERRQPGSQEPPSVRTIHHLRDALRRHWLGAAMTSVALGLAALAVSGLYTVDNGETAAVLRFGALVDDAVEPGLQISLAGIDEVIKTRTGVDEVLTSAKASIQNAARRSAQQRLDRYRAGVTVVAMSLQSVNPPREAAGAFRAVSDARAEAARLINRAQGERDRALRLARGEAEKLVAEANSAADRRRQEARGAAERFLALLRQKRQAPGPTHAELYNTTLQKVLPAARLVILAPGESPKIDVHIIERSETSTGIPPGVSFDDR